MRKKKLARRKVKRSNPCLPCNPSTRLTRFIKVRKNPNYENRETYEYDIGGKIIKIKSILNQIENAMIYKNFNDLDKINEILDPIITEFNKIEKLIKRF